MEQRRRFKTTTLAERANLVWMWVEGVPTRMIAQETGISVTTICRWVKRWQREGNVHTRRKRGRPRVIFEKKTANVGTTSYRFPASTTNSAAPTP